jgi:hypothetical protein
MFLFDRRLVAIAVSASALTVLSSGFRLGAQETSTSRLQKAKTAATKKDPTHRVPSYFGQLGLSDTQRESIYKVQAKHQPKIDDLEKQLEDARASLIRDCEKVLTTPQKTALEKLRRDAAQKRKAAAKEMEK